MYLHLTSRGAEAVDADEAVAVADLCFNLTPEISFRGTLKTED